MDASTTTEEERPSRRRARSSSLKRLNRLRSASPSSTRRVERADSPETGEQDQSEGETRSSRRGRSRGRALSNLSASVISTLQGMGSPKQSRQRGVQEVQVESWGESSGSGEGGGTRVLSREEKAQQQRLAEMQHVIQATGERSVNLDKRVLFQQQKEQRRGARASVNMAHISQQTMKALLTLPDKHKAANVSPVAHQFAQQLSQIQSLFVVPTDQLEVLDIAPGAFRQRVRESQLTNEELALLVIELFVPTAGTPARGVFMALRTLIIDILSMDEHTSRRTLVQRMRSAARLLDCSHLLFAAVADELTRLVQTYADKLTSQVLNELFAMSSLSGESQAAAAPAGAVMDGWDDLYEDDTRATYPSSSSTMSQEDKKLQDKLDTASDTLQQLQQRSSQITSVLADIHECLLGSEQAEREKWEALLGDKANASEGTRTAPQPQQQTQGRSRALSLFRKRDSSNNSSSGGGDGGKGQTTTQNNNNNANERDPEGTDEELGSNGVTMTSPWVFVTDLDDPSSTEINMALAECTSRLRVMTRGLQEVQEDLYMVGLHMEIDAQVARDSASTPKSMHTSEVKRIADWTNRRPKSIYNLMDNSQMRAFNEQFETTNTGETHGFQIGTLSITNSNSDNELATLAEEDETTGMDASSSSNNNSNTPILPITDVAVTLEELQDFVDSDLVTQALDTKLSLLSEEQQQPSSTTSSSSSSSSSSGRTSAESRRSMESDAGGDGDMNTQKRSSSVMQRIRDKTRSASPSFIRRKGRTPSASSDSGSSDAMAPRTSSSKRRWRGFSNATSKRKGSETLGQAVAAGTSALQLTLTLDELQSILTPDIDMKQVKNSGYANGICVQLRVSDAPKDKKHAELGVTGRVVRHLNAQFGHLKQQENRGTRRTKRINSLDKRKSSSDDSQDSARNLNALMERKRDSVKLTLSEDDVEAIASSVEEEQAKVDRRMESFVASTL